MYKGTSLVEEKALMDKPSGVVSFVMDGGMKGAAIAVSAGSHLYIYRNLKPFFKFSLPVLDVEKEELELWVRFREERISQDDLVKELNALLKAGSVKLSARSINSIELSDAAARSDYLESQRRVPLVQETVVTALGTVYKGVEEEGAVTCLVVGSEAQQVLILNGEANAIKVRVKLPSVPSSFACSGSVDVGYRILVACRDAALYSIKGGELMARMALEALPMDVCFVDARTHVVALINSTLHAFNAKNRKTFSLPLPSPPTALIPVAIERGASFRGFAVALRDGRVQVYNGSNVISTIDLGADPAVGMRFGCYGRESTVLVLVTASGTLSVKMLPRKVDFGTMGNSSAPPAEQDIPLPLPRKTKLWVEQQEREKAHFLDMHKIFQRDLIRLRLRTSKAYLKTLTAGAAPSTTSQSQSSPGSTLSLRLSSQIHGLGPNFKLKFQLHNTGSAPAINIPVVFSFNDMVYTLPKTTIVMPMLAPGLVYKMEVDVLCNSQGASGEITVYVCNPDSPVPIMSAIVNVPPSE